MTNVLLVGGYCLDHSLWTLWQGFQRAGCDVEYVPTFECPDGIRQERPNARTEILEHASEADMLLWWQAKHSFGLEFLQEIKRQNADIVLCSWSLDDPFIQTDGIPEEAERLTQFDKAFTCCAGALDWYHDHGVDATVAYTPCDPDLHGAATPDPEHECDVSFAGTNVYPPDRYPHVIANRADMVRTVADLGDVHLYGYWDHSGVGWGAADGLDEDYKPWCRGMMSHADMATIFASSRINLNSTVRPDGYGYVNRRIVEAMACGGFVLTDRVAGFEDIFTEGEELAMFGSLEELRDKASWYLEHEEKRAAVARVGRDRALTDWNNEDTANQMVGFAL